MTAVDLILFKNTLLWRAHRSSSATKLRNFNSTTLLAPTPENGPWLLPKARARLFIRVYHVKTVPRLSWPISNIQWAPQHQDHVRKAHGRAFQPWCSQASFQESGRHARAARSLAWTPWRQLRKTWSNQTFRVCDSAPSGQCAEAFVSAESSP